MVIAKIITSYENEIRLEVRIVITLEAMTAVNARTDKKQVVESCIPWV